jgi:hypothetical protein
MFRMLRVLLLVGLVAWAAGELTAQSAKKRTGPVLDVNGLKAQTYDFYKPEKVEKPLLYSFKLPKSLKGDEKDVADFTIQSTSLSVADMVAGIKGKFEPPAGYKIDEVIRVQEQKGGPAAITTVYIRGSYEKKPMYVMLAAHFKVKDQAYVFQLVGPQGAVGVHQSDFYALLKEFK